MKIAVVYNGKIRQVLDINDLSQLPDTFTFEVDEVQVTKQGEEVTKQKKQVTKRRNEVKLLKVNTDVQEGDIYVPEKGIFRFVGM